MSDRPAQIHSNPPAPLPAILLAAGGSTRMGRTKQLLPYRGRTLAWHAARTILDAGFAPLHVVVGHDADAVIESLSDLPVRIVRNEQWHRGIGCSLRAGVVAVGVDAPAALIALADQPGVSIDHLLALQAAWQPAGIAASHYDDALAVPAIFSRQWFGQLQQLPDEAGAKPILNRHADAVTPVPLPSFHDIDLPADYDRITSGR